MCVLYVCLLVCLFVVGNLSVCLATFVCLLNCFFCLLVSLSVCLCVRWLGVCWLVCLFVCMYVCMFVLFALLFVCFLFCGVTYDPSIQQSILLL